MHAARVATQQLQYDAEMPASIIVLWWILELMVWAGLPRPFAWLTRRACVRGGNKLNAASNAELTPSPALISAMNILVLGTSENGSKDLDLFPPAKMQSVRTRTTCTTIGQF